MKKYINLFIICLMFFFLICHVYAKPIITMEDIINYTKLSLERLRNDNLPIFTDVKVSNNAEDKMIEIECQYKGDLLKTAIEYDENLNLSPGVHTLKEAMHTTDCQNHTQNATLDTAINILQAFVPTNNELFAELTGYTVKDINKYFDLNKGTLSMNGYEKNDISDNFITINFNNFNLGVDAVAPTQSVTRDGNNVTIKIVSNEDDNTVIHIFRSLDNVNYEDYRDISLLNHDGSIKLSGTDIGYYYKSVVEGSNEWSEPLLIEENPQVGSDVDQETSNPQTGAIGISIALTLMLMLGVTYNILNKKKTIAKI